MKMLICSAAVALAFAVLIFAHYANARAGGNPDIDGAVRFPPRRWRIVRHTISLHMPQGSSPLSQLIIDFPKRLIVSNNITLTDNSEQKTNAKFSIRGNKFIVNFPQAVAPESELELDLNNGKRKRRGILTLGYTEFLPNL